jgi:putative two-component system response regulator
LRIIDLGYELPIKPKILVVDDEPAVQAVILDTLESDYRILSAFNGREGVQKAEHLKPDLILMDMMMPDVSGYEAVRLLQGSAVTRDIPVLVMTAQNFDDSTVQLIKEEPNVKGFLTKPFRPKILRDTVKATLQKSPS